MNDILKEIKRLLKRGYASESEKKNVADSLAQLKQEDQEALSDEAEQVKDLPEEDPEGGSGDEDEDEQLEKTIKSLMQGEREKMVSEVKEILDEHKDKARRQVGPYNPEIAAKRKETNDHMREFMKALLEDDQAKLKEMTTDQSGTPFAGYTVDTELSAEIRHLVTEYGVARREMTVIPLTKNSYKANNLATDVTVYWVDEGATINSTQAVLGQEELSLKKLGAIVTMTSELLEDTEIDFVSFIGSRVAEGFAQAEDEAFFKGDGTSSFGSFTGLLEADDVNETTMSGTAFSSIDADDLINMVDDTPQGALANGKFYMHRTIMSYIRKLKDDQGMYIYQMPSAAGPATIWGYPVVLVEAMPDKDSSAADTSFVLFGDLRKACILGVKASGLKMSRFNAGTVRNTADNGDINLITSDREAVRWVERTGYIRIVPTAVTKLTTAASSA